MYTRRQHVPVTLIRLESTRHVYNRPEEVETVLDVLSRSFSTFIGPMSCSPTAAIPITLGMIAEARRRTIPVVFALHNFAYTNARCVRQSITASSPRSLLGGITASGSGSIARLCRIRLTGIASRRTQSRAAVRHVC